MKIRSQWSLFSSVSSLGVRTESERRTETDHENEKLIKREAEKIGEEGGRVMKESKQLGK